MTDYKIVKAIRNGEEYELPGGGSAVEPKVDVLVVAGGGGGAGYYSNICGSGGGGAGGIIQCYNYEIQCNSYNVEVGSGGAGMTGMGCNGGNSCFGDLVACGGGGGAYNSRGSCGGSGGGHAILGTCGDCLENKVYGQGHRGGFMAYESNRYTGGGGGGGAYSDGRNSGYYVQNCSYCAGRGGDGIISDIGGSQQCFAAGGAGGSCFALQYGGNYGGGAGRCNMDGQDGWTCGSGGGGTGSSGCKGGSGACGVVIVRYKTDGSMGVNCATGGCVYCCDGYTIHCFTSDGTFCIVS